MDDAPRAVLERALIIAREQVALLEAALASDATSDGDLITLREAEREFRVSNDTARRWATDLGLGVRTPTGHWRLSRAKVRTFRLR